MNNNPMFLGLVLIVGAAMYSRSAKAGTTVGGYRPPGYGSMPSNVGSGANQVVSGVLGSIFNAFKNTSILPTWQTYDPTKPSEGVPYDPADPGAYVPLQDLVNGTVHDYATGDRSSYDIPTTTDIFGDVTGSSGGGFMGPGAYWQS